MLNDQSSAVDCIQFLIAREICISQPPSNYAPRMTKSNERLFDMCAKDKGTEFNSHLFALSIH